MAKDGVDEMKTIERLKTKYAFDGTHRMVTKDTFVDNEWVRCDITISTPADELFVVPDAIEPYAKGRYG